MLVNLFEMVDFLLLSRSGVHEVIVQAMRERRFAVRHRPDEVLCDPPWFVAEFGVEIPGPFPFCRAIVRLDCRNILAKPGQKLRIDFRTNILPWRVFAGHLKFPLKFQMLGWIEFEKETLAVS